MGEERIDGDWADALEAHAADAFDRPGFPADLREAVLRRTLALVRARRGRRRFLAAAALLVMFAAGAGAGFVTRGRVAEPTAGRDDRPAAALTPAAPPGDARAVIESIERSPARERAGALRKAGDGFLAPDRSDLTAALDCYQRHLVEPGANPEPEPEDSWLLLYLKVDRN